MIIIYVLNFILLLLFFFFGVENHEKYLPRILDAYETHEWGWGVLCSRFSGVVAAGGFITGFSSFTGVGGASFRGGILSFMASSPFASANDVILWFGEKPWSAKSHDNFLFIFILTLFITISFCIMTASYICIYINIVHIFNLQKNVWKKKRKKFFFPHFFLFFWISFFFILTILKGRFSTR